MPENIIYLKMWEIDDVQLEISSVYTQELILEACETLERTNLNTLKLMPTILLHNGFDDTIDFLTMYV